jgi:hypothetical protein
MANGVRLNVAAFTKEGKDGRIIHVCALKDGLR